MLRSANHESYTVEYDGGSNQSTQRSVDVYKGKYYISAEIRKDKCLFSDGRIHKQGNYIWLEVQPVTWIIDYESKALISKRGLIAGISFGIDASDKKRDYFLNKILLPDLFQLAKLPEWKKNKVSSEIEQIKGEIDNYKKYSLSDENIDAKVTNLIHNYNSKIDKLIDGEENGSSLTVEQTDEKKLFCELKIELTSILNQLKSDSKKVRTYFDMLEMLQECKSGKVDNRSGGLRTFVGTIKNKILASPILEKERENLTSKFNAAIDAYIEVVKSYIEDAKISKKPIKSVAELIEEFKISLTPFLLDLSKTIMAQDVTEDILRETQESINNISSGTYTSMIKNLWTSIKEDEEIIKAHGKDEEKECLKLLDGVNLFKSQVELYKELNDTIVPIIHRTRVAVENRKNRIEQLNEYRVDLSGERPKRINLSLDDKKQ